MNRRNFTKSILAAGLLPALPSISIAATPAPAFTPYMYGLAAHFARASGTSTASLLAKKLLLSPSAAAAMQRRLIANGVVNAPNAAGLATATRPFIKGRIGVGSGIKLGENITKIAHKISEVADIQADEALDVEPRA